MFHLTARVAWHDSAWNGTVCQNPSGNVFCLALARIRKERDDASEGAIAGKLWSSLPPEKLPCCTAEAAGFMNATKWVRRFQHPYVENKNTRDTHGHLEATDVQVGSYSTFAVPFRWMLIENQDDIDEKLLEPLVSDTEAPFETPWVFGAARQEALLNLFFGRLVPDKSLVFFYSKEGSPLGDSISRLVVGVGCITKILPFHTYETRNNKPTYPMWDRQFKHSIRPEGEDGFLFPYHEYLEETGDLNENERRLELLKEIAVAPDPAHTMTFSYAAELATPDTALSTLVKCLESVRRIRTHGIAKGPWERREEWLNERIAETWQDRGAFPGFGPALEALGMRLGTALALELLSSSALKSDEDPWPLADQLLRGTKKPPQSAYAADLKAVRDSWLNLDDDRKSLLNLLSRFALTSKQMLRCYDPAKRALATTVKISDAEIIANPYRISEVDLGDSDDSPVSVGTIDRGLLPESTIAAKNPVPEASRVESQNDPRRVRAAIVSVLRQAAENGDSLLSVQEALTKISKLDLAHPCTINSDWPAANSAALEGVVEHVKVLSGGEQTQNLAGLQLSELRFREERLRSTLSKRAAKASPSVQVDWERLLVTAITGAGGVFDPQNLRHALAIKEQVAALEKLTQRRLSVLIGRAGSGKTSVMGAVMLAEPIAKDGILLLAPTGKARVRLSAATNAQAMTVAQFLYSLKRYDGTRQRPRFTGDEKYTAEKTIIIDECSMLTMDDLFAVLEALDQAHVKRIILVGDPNQLPPIGVGRPFADLVSFLENEAERGLAAGDALARLTVEVRAAVSEEASDTLRLASWFTREFQPVDADRVLSDLELGHSFNDLQVLFWKTPAELQEQLLLAFSNHLGLKDASDIAGFDCSLGLDDKGWVPFDAPGGSENWQILSPVRMHSHGVHHLNRWIQKHFRGKELETALRFNGGLGDEVIVGKDKVIQTVNQKRKCYNFQTRVAGSDYLANGEVGIAAKVKGKLKGVFAGRPNVAFDYWSSQFGEGSAPLALAYALTVHKAQGSEFKKVFVILPKNCRIISRELLYTALTRSREQLVLLIEGDDASVLFDLTRPERSETARRNTNLFHGVLRREEEQVPYAEHLIHRTKKGHLVRSKSELIIADKLFDAGVQYEYERVFDGESEPGRFRPDFSFVTPDGDLIVWEHLGLMNRMDYRRGWEWKRQWYLQNGLIEGETLFVTEEDGHAGLDSNELSNLAHKIKRLCE